MKDKKMLYGIGVVFLFLATVGFSYAYFTTSIANKDVKDQVVETGTLSLRYVDGPEINMQNIKPGSTITKTVYVSNTGTLDASYNLIWQELVNEITNDEMVIEASCTRMNGQTEEVDGTCEGLTETPIKRVRIKENVSIEPSIVHKYDITITFKEMNKDQNYNQDKKFTGVLGVKEYKAPETIYCTFDGELTQGAEYVNGQYTYRYKQERVANYDGAESYIWTNIEEDGWGVQFTDNTSTEVVTDKLCTYINNKPIISMSWMFSDIDVTTLDLSSFDTSKVTNMYGMFAHSQAKTLDLGNFDTSNVTDMKLMFSFSKVETLDLSSFDTSNVTNMYSMFSSSKVKTLDLSGFDTSKVTDMEYMFWGSQATTIDLSNFNTSSVTDMKWMFRDSQATTIDLSSFNTSNVTNMSNMFYNVQATTVNISSFDTSNVTNMGAMFYNSTKLKTIYASNKFVTTNVTNSTGMFNSNINLVGGAGTVYDLAKVDKTYARIDGGTDSPGYFTLKSN